MNLKDYLKEHKYDKFVELSEWGFPFPDYNRYFIKATSSMSRCDMHAKSPSIRFWYLNKYPDELFHLGWFFIFEYAIFGLKGGLKSGYCEMNNYIALKLFGDLNPTDFVLYPIKLNDDNFEFGGWKEENIDIKKRIRQIRDALNKCRDIKRIEECAKILGA